MTRKDLVCFLVIDQFNFLYLYLEVDLSAPTVFRTICSPLGDSKPPPWGSVSHHFLLSSLAALPVWCPGTAGSAGTHRLIHWAHLQANVNSFQNLSWEINSFFHLVLVSGRPRLPQKQGTHVGAIKEIYSFLLQWGRWTISHNKPLYSQVIDQLFVSYAQ